MTMLLFILNEVIEESDKSSITISIALFNLEGEVVQTILQNIRIVPIIRLSFIPSNKGH